MAKIDVLPSEGGIWVHPLNKILCLLKKKKTQVILSVLCPLLCNSPRPQYFTDVR